MSETMYDCYLTQFDCMSRLLDKKDEVVKGFVEFYLQKRPDKLYLIGSGTSNNTCGVAAAYMEEMLGIEATVLAPSTAGKLYGASPMAIVVSQSGRSTNTIAMLERIQEAGVPTVTLTDPADTPIGNAGNLAVSLKADREPIGQRTRGHTTAVLTLYLMALEASLAAGSITRAVYDGQFANLREVIGRGPEYFAACQAFYDEHLENLAKARHFLFAGKGTAGQVAREDALKVLETVCYPSAGYEFEEFLHGPVCSVCDTLALFLFLPEDHDNARMLKLAEVASTVSPNIYLVSHCGMKGKNILSLPSPDPARLSPFTDILLGQLISAKLPEAVGHGRPPVVMEIYSHMNTKLRPKA